MTAFPASIILIRLGMGALLVILLFAVPDLKGQAGTNLVSFSHVPRRDKAGNEWVLEQNGSLPRSGAGSSLINGCMTLQIGTLQFYTQQPMMTPDGHEVVLPGAQPLNGIAINRRVTLLGSENRLRYVEEFTNTTSRNVTFDIELRHNFNGQPQGFLSDAGRPVTDALEAGESGVVVLPGTSEPKAPAVLFTVCAPGAAAPPRLAVRSPYQLSVIHNLTLPAGETRFLIHSIGQTKLPGNGKPAAIAKVFLPFGMASLTKGMPKATLKLASNLIRKMPGPALGLWFPAERWGIAAEGSDVLALDAVSRLKGRVAWTRLTWRHRFGEADVRLQDVAAIAGPRFTRNGKSRLWLRDGQLWDGEANIEGMRFTLVNGLEMELAPDQLDRLVLAAPANGAPSLTNTLVETWSGERFALTTTGSWRAESPWGTLTVPWSDTIALTAPADGDMAERLYLQDGTRVRVLPMPVTVPVQTRSFGQQTFDFAQLRQAITPLALSFDAAADDDDATDSFIDLAGDQRLLARITNATIRVLTLGAPLDVAPAGIRDLKVTTAAPESHLVSDAPVFQADLWGGGTVVGSLRESSLRVEGRGFSWDVPVRWITRIGNPVPVTDSALMRRIGVLLQELGDAQWQMREKATSELRAMGMLAKGSLQEALKTATDAEVKRRVEELLAPFE